MFSKTEEYFLTIVNAGSLQRAAEILFVSQPSLTKCIQRLETQLGTSLFDRSVSPMRLNDAGKLYYHHLLGLREKERILMDSLTQINHRESGTLRLGIPSYCEQCYLPEIMRQFIARYPLVNVELLEGPGETIEKALTNQTIDIGIIHFPVRNPDLVYESILSERILLAVPSPRNTGSGTYETEFRSASIFQFGKQPFILPTMEQKLGFVVLRAMESAGFRPNVLLRTNNVMFMLSLCAKGVGACFVPESGLALQAPHILNNISCYRIQELEKQDWKLVSVCRKDYICPGYTTFFLQLLHQFDRTAQLTAESFAPVR